MLRGRYLRIEDRFVKQYFLAPLYCPGNFFRIRNQKPVYQFPVQILIVAERKNLIKNISISKTAGSMVSRLAKEILTQDRKYTRFIIN